MVGNWTGRLAGASARHPWRVAGIWLAALLVGAALFIGLGDALRQTDSPATSGTSNPDSAIGADLIEERFQRPDLAQELVVVQSDGFTVDDPAYAAYVNELVSEIRGLNGIVLEATSYFESGDATLVSDDRRTTIVPVTLAAESDDAHESVGGLIDLVNESSAREGFTVATGGEASINATLIEASEDSLMKGERIGAPLALLILLLVFGALVAAGVPILIGITAVFVSLGTAALIGQVFDLSLFVVNMIFMIGLAVGIDYALFIVSRFREERRSTDDRIVAITRAGSTSSRAVFFSGLTVIVALLGMMIVPSTIFKSVSLGAVLVVTMAVAASLTLLPAILSLLDHRIERGRIPFLNRRSAEAPASGFWSRTARLVMRRPLISLATAVIVLVLVALPYLRIDLGLVNVSDFPEGSSPHTAFQILNDEFSAGLISPVEIVVDAGEVGNPAVVNGIEGLTGELQARPEFGPAQIETSPDGTLALISVPVAGEPESDLAHNAVRNLRDDIIPRSFAGSEADVYVTGQTAFSRDAIDQIERYTPYVFGFVLTTSFLLLMVTFRSVIIPIKSILMNLLSVGAAYGVLVAVFQLGVGNELFGFQQVDHIVMFLPLFMFSVLFGLSMDYHVFILSRVKEHYDLTRDNTASIEHGIGTTGGVITGAAAIMVAVFSGFAIGDFIQIQQLGFGLAVAVLLDATIVRSVLLPATMRLLGDWNWYFPSWLEWLPKLNIEGVPAPRPEPVPAR